MPRRSQVRRWAALVTAWTVIGAALSGWAWWESTDPVRVALARLKRGGTDERRDAAVVLVNVEGREGETVPALIGSLGDPNPEVRRIAMIGLAEQFDDYQRRGGRVRPLPPRLRDAIVSAMANEEDELRRVDLRGVAQLGQLEEQTEVVEALHRLALDSGTSEEARSRAVEAWAWTSSEKLEAWERTRALLDSPSPEVRARGVRTLDIMCWEHDNKNKTEARAFAKEDGARDFLYECLSRRHDDPDPLVRWEVVKALPLTSLRSEAPRALPWLLAAMREPQEPFVLLAAPRLGRAAQGTPWTPEALAALAGALGSPSQETVLAATRGLGNLGADAAPALPRLARLASKGPPFDHESSRAIRSIVADRASARPWEWLP